MTRKCWKQVAALTWAFLECMFFSSVVLGWTWLAIVLRSNAYFPEYCNVTLQNVTHPMDMDLKVKSTNRIVASEGGMKPRTQQNNKACRSSRSLDDSTAMANGDSFIHEGIFFRDKPGGSGSVSLSLVDATSRLEPRVVVRDILVEGEWTSRVSTQAQMRFKRGHGANISSASLGSISLTAVSLPHSGPEDLVPNQPHRTLSIRVIGYCLEQNEQLRLMFALVVILRDVLTFPLGLFFDTYGTTRTRLLTVLIFALGTLMMTFTSASVPWLVVPALTLTGVAGSAVLLTNLQTANLFGRKRHLVVSMYVGAAYSNGIITFLMQLSHFNGVDIQTSFMFFTIGIVPMLVSTVAFLPKTRVPWPLPADYGKRRNQSLDENMLRKQRAWQRRMSVDDPERDLDTKMCPEPSLPNYDLTEAGDIVCRKPPPSFSPSAVQSLFVWSVVWFGIQKLHEAVFETRVVDVANVEVVGSLDFESYFGFVQLLGAFCSPLVGVLIDRHFSKELGSSQATGQMQRIIPAIILTSCLALAEIVTAMFPGLAPQTISTLFNILHKVFNQTTMCAFVMHVHFNHQHLGKFYGLTCAVSAVFTAFQFPVRTFLVKKCASMLPAHILLLILSVISFAHALNTWNHCRKRLIRDQSDRSSERNPRVISGHAPPSVHIETDDSNLPENKGVSGDECESRAGPGDNVTQAKSLDVVGSIEMSDVSTEHSDGRNGGYRIIVETPYRGDAVREDDTYGDEDEDEEAIIATAMEFIKI